MYDGLKDAVKCFLGFHRWRHFTLWLQEKKVRAMRQCFRCGRLEEFDGSRYYPWRKQ